MNIMDGSSAVTVFFLFVLLLRTDLPTTVAAHDQTGLISVSCNWTSGSYIHSEHGILWMSEGIIINNSGRCVSLPGETNSQIRIFPEGFKNCYIFSTLLGQQYLIRGIFYYGNYDQKSKPPVFNVSIDATFAFQVSTSLNCYNLYEVVVTAIGYNLSYCLTKIPNGGTPLISKLEFFHSPAVAYFGGNTSLVMRKMRHVDNGNGYFLYRSFNNAMVVPDNTMDMPANATSKHPWLKVLIGCSVGVSVLLLLLFAAVTFACFFKRPEKLLSIETSVTYQSPPNYIARTFCETECIELKSLHIHKFSLPELATATNSFSNRIGEGGFGAVYRGTLSDGQAVAVKVWSASSIQGIREFTNEVDLLSGVKHENLVPLIGYCPQQQILVYHYMSNGSLQDRLYGEAACRKPLDWITRLNIALGAARGLNYLHTAAVRCIIHRDVKSSNILLDDSMVAKVADFGFSKYAPQEDDSIVSLEVRGTAGYMDPEYYSTQQLTVKSDVFSFGVVLLEIVCGREPLNIHRPRSEWSLVEWAKPFIQKSNIEAIVDSAISSSYTPEAMWRVLEIALSSVEPLGAHRPTMADVIRELEDALIIENNASQYMASIESLCSSHMPMGVPVGDAKMPPAIPLFYQFEPSPVFSETLGSPGPR